MADQLAKLADPRDREVISPEEFERDKAKILTAISATGPRRAGAQSARACTLPQVTTEPRRHRETAAGSRSG